MKPVITTLLFSLSVVLLSCTQNETTTYSAITIIEKNLTPTVDIANYTLLQAQHEDRQSDAEMILNVKRKWPLVMQAPSSIGFDTLLSKNFTFTDNGKLFNRQDYITDRLAASDWKITLVTYTNLTLQFFNDTALLTYKNQVTNEHVITKEVEIEYISWADIYVQENNTWKIGATHVVDFRMEKSPNP
ncbi:MAG: nuclear transport factor 2 family protein [Cytophagales bacterium]|nr:nuclear transport factor 2 family protein [Cytophagales bacterium]